MKLIYHPQARIEERKATIWYRKESVELAKRFQDDLRSTFDRIMAAPQQFTSLRGGKRKALLDVFPYVVIFIPLSNVTYIVAIAHASRHPEYWHER